MEYIVSIKQGGDEIKVKFSDAIRANMFAEMAAKGIVPDTYYGGDIKEVRVTMQFVPVVAEKQDQEQAEEPVTDENTEKEAE